MNKKNKIKIYLFLIISLIISQSFFIGDFFINQTVAKGSVVEATRGEVIIKLKNSDKLYLLEKKSDSDIDFILNNYQNNDQIEYAERNYKYYASMVPDDPDFLQQYYLRQVEALAAWDMTTGSSEVVVAVLDSGVDYDNPDLKHNIWVNANEKPFDRVDNDGNGMVDDFYGWNFVDNNNNIKPVFSSFSELGINHGTVVSGIIAARGNNNIGIAGASWQTKIMNLKVLDSSGVGDSLQVIRAIDYAINHDADIINLSVVGSNFSQSLQDAITRAWDAGLLIVAAAGNEVGKGVDMDITPAYPVCNDGSKNTVLGVVAVDWNNQRAEFSNYGNKCSDIAAPGINFYSTVVYNEEYPGFNHHFKGGYSGTSVATPLISGLAALIKSVNPKLTNEQISNIIVNTATNIDAVNPGNEGKLGSGLVNFSRAVGAAKATLIGVSDPVSQDWLVTGAGAGGGPHVRVFDYQGNVLNQFFAYDKNFRGGVAVATGDVDHDGVNEIITAAGKFGGPHIRIFDKQGNLKGQFFAYEHSFRGGVNLAVGDLDGDGQAEIVTAPQSDKEAIVKIFDYTGHLRYKFLAYADNFFGGAHLAIGDVDGDTNQEIITGAGYGGGPHVRVFSRQGRIKSQFFAYDKNFRGGVNLSISDIDNNGKSEIITGAGYGGGPHVRVFNNFGKLIKQFFAYDPDLRSGVRISTGDLTGDGNVEIVTAPVRDYLPEIRAFSTNGIFIKSIMAYNPRFKGGVFTDIINR